MSTSKRKQGTKASHTLDLTQVREKSTGITRIEVKKCKETRAENTASIGLVSETSLHASLKAYMAKPGDRFEVNTEGKIVDILRPDGEVVEIQTSAFGQLRAKIQSLAPSHPITIVYPLIQKKYIVKLDPRDGSILSRRASPKRQVIMDLFGELVYFPTLLNHKGVRLLCLFVECEELRSEDGRGSFRRHFQSILDKRLSLVGDSVVFESPTDLLRLLPKGLAPDFTSQDLAKAAGISRALAGKACYVLKNSGLSRDIGKQGRFSLYRLVPRHKGKVNGPQGKRKRLKDKGHT